MILILLSGLIFGNMYQPNYEVYKTVNQGVFIIIGIMIVGQLIFILNLIISLTRNEKRI